MTRTRIATGALALALGCACGGTGVGPSGDPGQIFHGPVFYTGHPDWNAVEALHVVAGRVVASGELDQLAAAAPGARRVRLGGTHAVPGLQDAHGHLENLGKSLETVDLRGVPSFAVLVERVAEAARGLPAGTWLEGRGWDQNLWPEKRFPHHAELSRATPEHPVVLRRVDGHATLVNARALAAAGLDGGFDVALQPEGGEVLLGEDGRATGVLVDAAMGLVARHVPAADEDTRARRLQLAHDALVRAGLTAVHDMGVDPWTVETIAGLRDAGRWRLRTVLYLSMRSGSDPADYAGFPRRADPRDVVCVPGVKLYADGALGSRGAALLEDYSDRPGHRGLLMIQPDELARCLGLCSELGLQPATHAIGDRGNRMVLDAYEAESERSPGFADLRPRIEHAQVVAREDWRRFARLGVIPSMQPTHCTSDMDWVPERVGDERSLGAYAWQRLAPDPAVLAFGSDFPVERWDPLPGLYAARTRQHPDGTPAGGWLPDQRVDARTALTGFTWGAAHAAHQEDRRGRLAPGYFADITVLDCDPLGDDPSDLLEAAVVGTVINGHVTYPAQSLELQTSR